MRAADMVEVWPTATLEDEVLPAVRMVVGEGLGGLVVADGHGVVIACLSSVDLLGLVLPSHLRARASLVRVLDEGGADQAAAGLVGVPLRTVLAEVTFGVPVAAPDATVAELAEVMSRQRSALALVRAHGGTALGVVTANRVLEVLTAG
jgi:CBS domain-containing protein